MSVRDDIERRRDFVIGVGLFALAAIVYLPTVRYDFVNWDDPWYVLKNPVVKSWSPGNLYRLATTVQVRNFAPLTMFSFLVDHTLWAKWPGGYHVTNTFLHGLNAALVFALLRTLGTGRFVAGVSAALFAIHPVQVESVVWISARKGLLSGTFILASLICWLRPNRTGKDEAWGILWLTLALLSKAIAVVVPAIVLLYDLWVRRERFTAALPRQVIPGFLAFMLLQMTMNAQVVETGGVRGHLAYSKAYLVALDGTLLWQYVANIVWPTELSVLYDPPTEGINAWIVLAWAGWLAVATGAFLLRERLPWLRFGLASALILMVPVLNLFPLTTLMNDRYLYLPVIPLFALAVGGVHGWLHICLPEQLNENLKWLSWRRVGRSVALAGAAIVALAPATMRTMNYMPVWSDDLRLWQHARRHTPDLPVVRIQLAMALNQRGHERESIAELEGTLAELSPDAADERRIREKIVTWRRNLASKRDETTRRPSLEVHRR